LVEKFKNLNNLKNKLFIIMWLGDWRMRGLGIGPNHQSPLFSFNKFNQLIFIK
jgi:hypothetical protein